MYLVASLTLVVTGMNVYGVQPENSAPDVMIPDSDEKRALTRRKIIP